MKNKLKLLMQSWSFRPVGHLKFGPRAHVNHQQENVKDNLDVTLVYGKRDLEATKIVVSVCFCFCESDFKGGVWRLIAAVQQPDKS